MTQRHVASRLDVQYTTISHWETGRRLPSTEDVSAVLTVLGVRNPEREHILDLARRASESDWLETGRQLHGLAGVMECERSANAITNWSPWVVPGLLQTLEYARAVIGFDEPNTEYVERKLALRFARRAALPGVRLTALIGEPAIRQVIGGDYAMIDQLRRLIKATENRTVQVVPIGSGWHPGLAGPFHIFEFPDAPATVHLEHHRSSAFVYSATTVSEYLRAAKMIGERALSYTDSAKFIREVLDGLENP